MKWMYLAQSYVRWHAFVLVVSDHQVTLADRKVELRVTGYEDMGWMVEAYDCR